MEKYKPSYPPMRPGSALVAFALLAAAILAAMLFSCTAKKRVAASTTETDRTHTTTQQSTRQGSHRENTSIANWQQRYHEQYGRTADLYLKITTVIPPTLDSGGNMIDPGRTTTTEAHLAEKDSTRTRSEASGQQKAQAAEHDSTRTTSDTDTQADIHRTAEEKAFPVERTAMWTFFTVAALLGAGGFVWWRLKRKR